ncbi:TOMM precursor leader peptide-binding protein [Streptomyces sp. NBC_00344]|uniref:TOMM precursor leader peptide-binding protein n=1 Tax=Streptomyces sp. NBC_00344 TaxID=2975720 RepID=UPI002E22DA1E
MHPMVKPALRRAWRDRQSVQFGVTPAQAMVLGPIDTATGCLLDLLDGTRGPDLLRQEARALRLTEHHLDELLSRLTAAGLIDDATAGGEAADALRKRSSTVDRLRPDLASLSLIHPGPGAGTARLAARRAVRIQVRGAGRVGAAVAALLSASGVGQVEVLDGGCVEPWDIAPGGFPAEAAGERRDTAARRLVRRSAPGTPPRAAGKGTGTDGGPGLSLIVVAPRDGFAAYVPDPAHAADWITSGTPHLYTGVLEGTGIVGPLVLPGGTACSGCLALRRAERDPGWPRMVAQWRSGRRNPVQACDLGLATAVAGLAAAHALTFIDGDLPASTGARCEASLPLLDWRSARIGPHPDCSCGASGHTEGERPSGAGVPHDTMAG